MLERRRTRNYSKLFNWSWSCAMLIESLISWLVVSISYMGGRDKSGCIPNTTPTLDQPDNNWFSFELLFTLQMYAFQSIFACCEVTDGLWGWRYVSSFRRGILIRSSVSTSLISLCESCILRLVLWHLQVFLSRNDQSYSKDVHRKSLTHVLRICGVMR